VNKRESRLIVVSAPSGVGKSTVCGRLRALHDDVAVSISYTTRDLRGGERDGVHYHFVDDARFDAMIASNSFLEWAPVHARRYGTGRQDCESLLAEGKDVLFDIDVQGGAQIKAQREDAMLVFLVPPTVSEWVRRLRDRGTDAEDVIALRLRNAIAEMEQGKTYEYLLINDDLAAVVRELDELRQAEQPRKRKTSGSMKHLEELLAKARLELT